MDFKHFLKIKENGATKFINLAQVLYIDFYEDSAMFHLSSGKPLEIRKQAIGEENFIEFRNLFFPEAYIKTLG